MANDVIQIRRDTLSNWGTVNPVLAQGEIGLILNSSTSEVEAFKIGDGTTAFSSLQTQAGTPKNLTEITDPAGNDLLMVYRNGTGLVSAKVSNLPSGGSGNLPVGVQGDILYHDGTDWTVLNAGVNGQFLQTQGAESNPEWVSISDYTTFLSLSDTPSSYTGQALKGVRVNALESQLEFYSISGGTDEFIKISSNDTTPGYLEDKLLGTANKIILTVNNEGANETITINVGSHIFDTTVTGQIMALTGKTTPIDADVFLLEDTADTNSKKKITWANIKATLETYFDTLYQAVLVSGTNIKTINSTNILGSGNITVEPTITAGTTAQYWRGDKSWQTLDKTAVGLNNVTNDAQLKIASNLSDVNNQQTALNNITAVSGATNEYVLTKDTATGNATWKASQGGGGAILAKLQEIYGLLANQNGVNYTGTLNNNTITVHTTAASSKSFFNFSFTNTTTTAQTISLLVDDIVVYIEELNAGENRNLADALHQPYFVADTSIKVQSTSTTIDYNINVIDVLDSELTGFFMLVGNTTGSEQTLKTAGASTKIKLLGEVFSNTDTVNRTITTKINDKAILSAQTIGVNQGCLAMLNQGKTINSSQTYKITSSSSNVKYLIFGYEG